MCVLETQARESILLSKQQRFENILKFFDLDNECITQNKKKHCNEYTYDNDYIFLKNCRSSSH